MNTKKNYIYIGIVLFVVIIGLEIIGRYFFDHPDFIQEAIMNAKHDKELMREIGGYFGHESSFFPDDLNTKDTVDYFFTIKGNIKSVEFHGKASIGADEVWETISVERVSE